MVHPEKQGQGREIYHQRARCTDAEPMNLQHESDVAEGD